MPRVVNIQDLLAAVKTRWEAQGLASVPLSQVAPQELTARPYATLSNVVETNRTRTNQSRVRDCRFTLTLYHATPEDAGTLAKDVVAALEDAPLVVSGGTVLAVEAMPLRFFESSYYTRAVIDVYAQLQHTVTSYSPA